MSTVAIKLMCEFVCSVTN